MVTKRMMAAVAFDTGYLQNYISRNDGSKIISKKVTVRNGYKAKDTSKNRRRNFTLAEKVNIRRERNKNAAQASRVKSKLQEDFLKQRLFCLEYETMKLLLENETLKKQHNDLELENSILKFKAQRLSIGSVNKENDVEATFKHAWFVNIPQQKEWVLPRIFIILIMLMWKAVKSAIILNYWKLYINGQLSLNRSLKHFLSHIHQPLMLTISLACHPHNPKVPNG